VGAEAKGGQIDCAGPGLRDDVVRLAPDTRVLRAPSEAAVFALCLALGNASNYAYSLLFGSISHRSQIAASLLNAMLVPLAFALTLAGLPALNTWSLVTVLAGLEYLGIAYYLHSRLLKASSLGGWS